MRSALAGLRAQLARTISGAPVDGYSGAAPPIDHDLGPGLTLERLLDERKLISFRMSRLQRAFVRACDGTPLDTKSDAPNWATLTAEEMGHHFHQSALPALLPTTILPVTGVRAGKTLISGAGLIKSVFTCSLRHVPSPEELADGVLPDDDGMTGVRPGELVRAPIVTPKMGAGRQCFANVLSHLQNSPRLRPYVVHATMEKIIVRRPCDGHHVLIELCAAAAGGTNLRSTWLAGIVFDEAWFFDDGEDSSHVVNLSDNYDAAVSRMLPGAQVWMPTSPWADSGTYYAMWQAALGTFGQVEDGYPSTVLAFHATSRQMNPALDRKLEARMRRRDPMKAQREYDAIPLSTESNLCFPPTTLELAINMRRPEHLPYAPFIEHYAGADLGFRRNSSTLAIARPEQRLVNGVMRAVAVLCWTDERIPKPGKPLVPGEVMQDFGRACQAYGVERIQADRVDFESAQENLAKLDGAVVSMLEYDTSPENTAKTFIRCRELMAEGQIEIPNNPRLLGQIKRILLNHLSGGRTTVVLPKQGRAHGDLALAAILALVQAADAFRYLAPPDARWDSFQPRLDSSGL